MASGLSYQENAPSKSGFYISKCAAFVAVLVVVLLLVAEGLLVGLIGRQNCDLQSTSQSKTTTITATKTTAANSITTTNSVISASTAAVETTTDANTSAIWYNNRLPDSLIPISYEVKLRPVLEVDSDTDMFIFYGSSSVTYRCNTSTEYIVMHSSDLNYREPLNDAFTLHDDTDGINVSIVEAMFYLPNEYVILTTSSPCVVGSNYTLKAASFQGELGDDLNGIYRSEYDNKEGVHRVIAASQMESTGARHTFPCFDEPAMKATFLITLYHQTTEGYFAVSNMPPADHQSETIDGVMWNSTTFQVSPIMSTYLVAVVVCDFPYEEAFAAQGSIQTRIYARDIPVENGEVVYASQVSPQILDTFASYYKVAYPLPKSDQMAVSDFGPGAMENWGLVLYKESRLLYKEKVSSIRNQLSVVQVIAHELAHQWFGNLVTAAWWSDIWLNEGFASYVQYIGVGGVYPTWDQDQLFVIDDLQAALAADDTFASHPLFNPARDFSTIPYSKGASFLRMVNEFLGESTFTNALTNYLNDRAYDVATHDVLFQFWIEEAKKDNLTFPFDLQKVFETWVLQMGYPLLRVSHTAADTITISQEHFLIDPKEEYVGTPGSDIYNYKWYVPFTYKLASSVQSQNGSYEHLWMNLDDNLALVTTERYILANINAVGFYRVLYEDTIWENLIEKMNSATFEDISPQNRAQLMDDAFAISRSGKLSIGSAFSITNYLHQEVDYIPWETFLASISYFDKMLGRSTAYGSLSEYILDMVVPSIYAKYAWNDTNTSDVLLFERLTSGLAIEAACYYGHQECISTAAVMYSTWMQNPYNNTISTTYRQHVYCTAIKAGGVEEWDFAWERYLAIDSAQERTNLRYAMSCSKDPWLINRYIEYSLDDTKVRNQDIGQTLSYIGGQEYGKYVAWSFAINNWKILMDSVGENPTSEMLAAAVERFSTTFDLELLLEEDEGIGYRPQSIDVGMNLKIEDLSQIAGNDWKETFDSFRKSVHTNMAWREENEDKISAWLGSAV